MRATARRSLPARARAAYVAAARGRDRRTGRAAVRRVRNGRRPSRWGLDERGPAATRRHHHGWERPLGEGPQVSSRIRGHAEGVESVRTITRALRARSQAGAAHALRVLGRELEAPAPRGQRCSCVCCVASSIRERDEIMEQQDPPDGHRTPPPPAGGRSQAELEKTKRDVAATTSGMILNLALSYGGRQEIVDATRSRRSRGASWPAKSSPDEITEEIVRGTPVPGGHAAPPDLLIRTAGEYARERISCSGRSATPSCT